MNLLKKLTITKRSILFGALLAGPGTLTAACGDDVEPGEAGTAGTGGAGTGTTAPPGTTGTLDGTGESTDTDGSPQTGDATSTGGTEPTAFEQAVEAIGGEDALNDLERLQIDSTGRRSLDFERSQPTEVVDVSTYVTRYTWDVPNDNFRMDTEKTPLFESFAFGPPQNYAVVLNGDLGGLTAQAGFIAPGNLPSQIVGAMQTQQRLLNPHFYLRAGLADLTLVGDAGAGDFDGRPHRIITFAGEITEILLFVDDETGFISKLETVENSFLARDVPVEVHYSDWQTQGSLAFPDGVELYASGGLVVDETRTAVEIEPDLPGDNFELPPEAVDPTLDAGAHEFGQQTHQAVEGFFHLGFPYLESPAFSSSQIVPGVTLLASGVNSVAISYDGGLVVLEAPNTPAYGSELIDSLALTFPGLAITHIVQSHHHQDHSSAVRSFVAEGATLVVGDGAGAFWDGILSAESTIRPDALADVDVTPDIQELVEDGTFVVDDANVTITVHHVTASTHADDMVITVIDIGGERFVYEADFYNAGFGFTLAIGGPEELFAILRDLAIIDASCASAVPLTIIPGHGVPQTLADSLTELGGLGVDVGCT